jgi:serine/threonine-protein kinase HipA
MQRAANIYFHGLHAGLLSETDSGYRFLYNESYASQTDAQAISKTLPKQTAAFDSKVLFPFFDGLVPEGWLLDIAIDNWKLNGRDRFGLLLACCKNTIGAVSVRELANEELM